MQTEERRFKGVFLMVDRHNGHDNNDEKIVVGHLVYRNVLVYLFNHDSTYISCTKTIKIGALGWRFLQISQ